MRIINLDEIEIPIHCFMFIVKNKDTFFSIVNKDRNEIVFKVKIHTEKNKHLCLVYIDTEHPEYVWIYDIDKNGK